MLTHLPSRCWLRALRILLLVGFAVVSLMAHADALVVVCYNWSCKDRVAVTYSEPWLRKALQPLRQAKTPEAERDAVAETVRRRAMMKTRMSMAGWIALIIQQRPAICSSCFSNVSCCAGMT